MSLIEELWTKLKDVELVQVKPSEMLALYEHCLEFTSPLIVEVGSAHGASSIILAEAARKVDGNVICIDTYPENYYHQVGFGSYAKNAFLNNLESYKDVVSLFNYDSSKAKDLIVEPISVLFIDGDHEYDGVKSDCINLLPMLKSGGYVGFHDYNNVEFSGVKKAADEFCEGWEKESIWDLVIFKKP